MAHMSGLQRVLETHNTENLRKLEVDLRREYIEILMQEELL